MVSKIEKITQPVFDYRKHNLQKPKDGLKKKESTSFASVLENTIKSRSAAIKFASPGSKSAQTSVRRDI
jgi:hypothetical protein